jgi:hypothetical protein
MRLSHLRTWTAEEPKAVCLAGDRVPLAVDARTLPAGLGDLDRPRFFLSLPTGLWCRPFRMGVDKEAVEFSPVALAVSTSSGRDGTIASVMPGSRLRKMFAATFSIPLGGAEAENAASLRAYRLQRRPSGGDVDDRRPEARASCSLFLTAASSSSRFSHFFRSSTSAASLSCSACSCAACVVIWWQQRGRQ